MSSIVSSVRVEIFSDVVCPWCYIGKTRFDAALSRLNERLGEGEISVSYQPFQLDPSAPIGAARPVVESYAKKFGGPDQARAILDRVTATAAQDGLSISMDRALRANTRLAHRLLLAVETDPVLQSTLYDELFRAYFCNGDDIGDPTSLRRIANAAGLNSVASKTALESDALDGQLTERLARAADRGITAVPTFVIDDQWSIPGAQDIEFFERTLYRLLTAQ